MRLQPSGAYAANLLGLTEQVPMKLALLTDGASRTVQVGSQSILLKHTTPSNMATAGRISGLVIQALRHLKQASIDAQMVARLRARLSAQERLCCWQTRRWHRYGLRKSCVTLHATRVNRCRSFLTSPQQTSA